MVLNSIPYGHTWHQSSRCSRTKRKELSHLSFKFLPQAGVQRIESQGVQKTSRPGYTKKLISSDSVPYLCVCVFLILFFVRRPQVKSLFTMRCSCQVAPQLWQGDGQRTARPTTNAATRWMVNPRQASSVDTWYPISWLWIPDLGSVTSRASRDTNRDDDRHKTCFVVQCALFLGAS